MLGPEHHEDKEQDLEHNSKFYRKAAQRAKGKADVLLVACAVEEMHYSFLP